MDITSIPLPLLGIGTGIILGYIARRNFFCTLSSLEHYWYANNSTGVRTWVLATTIAILFTQILVLSGIIDVSGSIYMLPNFSWLGAIVGGLVFGIGMAFIGTCPYGALIRLGGGSLKSLMAILVMGLAGLSAQKGILALIRQDYFDPLQIDLSFADNQSIPAVLSALSGFDLSLVFPVVLVIVLLYWIFRDREYRKDISNIITGTIIGIVVAAGWWITSTYADASFDPVQVESASFIAPISDVIMHFSIITDAVPSYGLGTVIGVLIGAAAAARIQDNVRWEACDSARELKRHIVGAVMIGFGGVLAMGCTIGQGVSAASLLAASVPLTMVSILIGARLGLAYLLEGSFIAVFRTE